MDIDTSKFGHIGILMGGYSSEREISLKSGQAVLEALKKTNCRVTPLDITMKDEREIEKFIKDSGIDVAFIALHGKLGEDGVIQSILERLDIPYTGSGVEASQRAINKIKTQLLLKENKIPVAPHVICSSKDTIDPKHLVKEIGLPLVVKPASEGSSIGITIVQTEKDIAPALKIAFEYGDSVLIEGFIQGRELTVGILDNKFLPIIEIRPQAQFFDFKAKYKSGTTEYIIPAQLPDAVAKSIGETALYAHQVLGCRDFSRIDVMLDKNNKPYILEINTIPGFTSVSLLPKAAKQAGLEFPQLCLKLIELAYEKKKQYK